MDLLNIDHQLTANHILSIIHEKRQDGLQVMGIFLDIEDAFNNVNLSKLQSIMNRMGVPIQYANWLINCYQNREIIIETVDGNKNGISKNGVPQGDVLSPVAFLLYTAPLFGLDIENTALFQFADDLCILSWNFDMIEVTESLQLATDNIVQLIRSLDMRISPSKTKAMWFYPQYQIYQPVIKIAGEKIQFENL